MSAPRHPERTLVVWCPDWAVTAAGYDPEVAVAVVANAEVVAASATARGSGVAPGQRRREAESCCPSLVVVPDDPGGETRAFEAVAVALEGFGAPVAVARPGWTACATRGPARYFGGEEAFAATVGRAVEATAERLGLVPTSEGAGRAPLVGRWWRVGIADGPFAATIAAQLGRIVPAGDAASFLAPFGVELLGRPELAEVLGRLGIPTIGGFAALAEADVLARFGQDGARAHRLARGLDGRHPATRRHAEDHAVEMEVDPPAGSVDATAFLAKQLAGRLSTALEAAGLACTLLEIEAETSAGEHLSRRWAHEGAWRPAVVAERLRWQLEAWLSIPGGQTALAETTETVGITRLRLAPLEVVADVGSQLELWGRHHADEERVARALARAQGILGPEEVVLPYLVGGRGPRERVRYVPFGDPSPATAPEVPWPGRLPSPNPTAVPAEPIPAELLDRAGQRVGVDGRGATTAPPAVLALGDRPPVPIVAWAGPWPVDERWWDRRSRRRRARFQVLTAPGDAYLLALEQGRWVVEGSYD